MWVRLTDRQLWHVYRAMDAWDADIAAELRVNVLHPTTNRYQVEAPYVAWDTVRRVMMNNVYSPGGGKRKSIPSAMATAVRAVTAGQNALTRHPAMKGAGLATHDQQPWFPVWRLPEPDQFQRIFTPMPVLGLEFVVLVPQREKVSGIPVTLWRPDATGTTDGLRLASEQLHLSLLR